MRAGSLAWPGRLRETICLAPRPRWSRRKAKTTGQVSLSQAWRECGAVPVRGQNYLETRWKHQSLDHAGTGSTAANARPADGREITFSFPTPEPPAQMSFPPPWPRSRHPQPARPLALTPSNVEPRQPGALDWTAPYLLACGPPGWRLGERPPKPPQLQSLDHSPFRLRLPPFGHPRPFSLPSLHASLLIPSTFKGSPHLSPPSPRAGQDLSQDSRHRAMPSPCRFVQ